MSGALAGTASEPPVGSTASSGSAALGERPSKFVVIEKEGTHWPSDPQQYEKGALIGIGASAKVYEATCLANKRKVAIKVQDLDQISTAALELIRREISMMANLDHPNVVRYYTSFVVGKDLWMVMKFLTGGSVYDIMRFHGVGERAGESFQFDEAFIATVLRETLKGLEYFHKNGKIHRDIKAGNILIDESGKVQIADFGVSAAIVDSGRVRKAQTFVGTPCWMAPEVMEQSGKYDYKADIWSFGITALELANGKPPNSDEPPMKVLMKTLQEPPPKLEGRRERGFSKAFKELIALCLNKNPNERPSTTKLLEHRFFKSARKEDYLKEYIQGLPSLSARFKMLQHNEANKEPEESGKKATMGWDFGGEEDDTPVAAQESKTAPAAVPASHTVSQPAAVGAGKFSVKDLSQVSATESAPAAAPTVAATNSASSSSASSSQGQSHGQSQGSSSSNNNNNNNNKFKVSEIRAAEATPATPKSRDVDSGRRDQFHTPPTSLDHGAANGKQQQTPEELARMQAEMEHLRAEVERLKAKAGEKQ